MCVGVRMPRSKWRIMLSSGGSIARSRPGSSSRGGFGMNNIIYIVGLIVIIVAILSFFGLR